MTLVPFATIDDVSARGIDTTDDAGIAAALDSASAAIRDAAGNAISELTSTVSVTAPRGNLLTLPGPITAVASVSIDGGTALVLGTDYYILPNGLWRGVGWDYCNRPVPIAVTFTHGYAEIPPDIVDLTCALVGMWVAAKTAGFSADPGLTSMRVDDYAETRSAESAGQSSPMWLPKATRAWLASRFGGGGAYVVEMGP